jgi:hypothetical protein
MIPAVWVFLRPLALRAGILWIFTKFVMLIGSAALDAELLRDDQKVGQNAGMMLNQISVQAFMGAVLAVLLLCEADGRRRGEALILANLGISRTITTAISLSGILIADVLFRLFA